MNLLEQVRADLIRRAPVDGREARSRHQALVALGRLTAPFDRHADPTHITGSAVVVGSDGVLLLRHKRLGIWVQPGGHLEPGETPWAAGRRESEEETGLRFASWPSDPPPLLHVDVHPGGSGHTHLDLRYLLAVEGDPTPRPAAGESQDVRWYGWEEVLSKADPGLAGLLRHLRSAPRSAAGPTVCFG